MPVYPGAPRFAGTRLWVLGATWAVCANVYQESKTRRTRALAGSIGLAKLDAPSSFQYECNRVSEQVEVPRCVFVKSRSPLATKMFFVPAVNEH
jgi:hypothetical protein